MKRLLNALVITLLLILLTFTISEPAYAVPSDNFVKTELISQGLENPTALEFAPDGRLFILEQGGKIKIYKNGTLLDRPFDELPAFANADRGLLGIAFDPDFSTNKFVYFYYIGTDLFHHVVRFDATTDTGRNGPIEIYKSAHVANSNHAGGTIQFGSDGKLYISVGDSGQPSNSQDLTNPLGKILRINKDGTIPDDNPYFGDTTKEQRIWAYGLRNPFRFQFDYETGDLYVGDVGDSKWEEINKITKSGNYGWPIAEGECSDCGFINPIYSYFHTTPSFSVTQGPVYHANTFPMDFHGSIFYGDYAQGFIKRLKLDGSGNVQESLDFENDAGTVVDLKVGPDGNLYYITIFPGKLFKIAYLEGNLPPQVSASANVVEGTEPLDVSFSSTVADPENDPLTYSWDFDDGTSSSNPNPLKTFMQKGVYNVVLTVSDGNSSVQSNPLQIQVGEVPTVTINSPDFEHLYTAGETLAYNVSAQDSEGNEIQGDHISVEILFHHDTHVHPFFRETIGNSAQFTIPTIGETAINVWYEIIAKATDSFGVVGETTQNIYPVTTSFSVETVASELFL